MAFSWHPRIIARKVLHSPTYPLPPPSLSLSLSQSSEIKTTWLCHNGVSDIADYVIEEMSVCNSAGYVSVRGRAVYFMTRFKIHDNVFCSVFVSLWSFYSANMHPSIITVHTLTHSLTHSHYFFYVSHNNFIFMIVLVTS